MYAILLYRSLKKEILGKLTIQVSHTWLEKTIIHISLQKINK